MEEGRKTRKRKADKLLQVQRQEDYHWEGREMHTELEGRRKKKKKKKKTSEASGEASFSSYTEHTVLKKKRKENKPQDVCIGHSVIKQRIKEKRPKTDYTVLKQKRKEKKPKNVCRDHTALKQKRKEKKSKNVLCTGEVPWPTNADEPAEEAEERSSSILDCTELAFEAKKKGIPYFLCKMKEDEQPREDVNIDVHGDSSASFEGNKPRRKKVRFSDQIPHFQSEQYVQAQEHVNIDVVHEDGSASSEGNNLRLKKVRFSDQIPHCQCKQNVQAQEDVNINMHGDRSASSEGNKPRCRFSDQIPHCQCKQNLQAQEGVHGDHIESSERNKPWCKKSDQILHCQCKQNVSQELCTHNSSVFKESLASGADQDKCTSTSSKREDGAASFRDGSMNRKPSLDEKVLLTRKRQRDEVDEIWGKRFTPEEDEILKNAVREYIKVKGWDEKEGIDKVLNCRKHKEAYNCWGAIRLSLPNRPRRAVRFRAYRLFEECTHSGPWSKQELELLKRLHETHGSQWKSLSTLMGRSQYSISAKWRILKRPNPTGVWTWDEIQRLSDMVHKCLRLKALFGARNEKSSRNYYLRDNISWDEIADAIGTHNHGSCCTKWYCNLSSPMVVDGLWASEDDCLLLKRLLESGACMEEEVEWHRLLNHRSGQTCLFRWKQMVKHLGENRTRGFLEKLDSLVRRYIPELLYPR